MKGIIFNLLEELVRRERGDDTWEALLDVTGLDGVFTSLGNYPDGRLFQLVGAASSALGQPPEAVLRWFGRSAIPLLAERYPHFFEDHRSTRDFLLTLNHIIHAEVRKLYPGADVPTFGFDTSSPDVLLIDYRSKRKLCSLAEGFVEGAADHYREQVTMDQSRCMNRGDDRCVLRLSFRKLEA